MPHKSPLETLQDLAKTRVDDATRKLGELIASERACEEKLQLLFQYRNEYRERFISAGKTGLDPTAWRNFSAFLQQLDDAIAQQQRIVDHSKQATVQGQQQWSHERNRAKAFDTLVHRVHVQQAHKEAKQEQKLSDEHGAKHYQGKHEEQ